MVYNSKRKKSVSKTSVKDGKRKTSLNNGHRHSWNKRNKYTSIDDGHKHLINLKKKIAEKADGHIHKLF